jgi:DNA invertase Pin-like site-specific DNA recombinase
MRGVIYARVSTDKQEYSRQIHELEAYAKRNDIDLVLPHLEEKESGFNSKRPEYNKLMNLTKEDVDIVLIWELSRLSRKSIEIQSDIEKLTEKGIDVYVHNKGLHTLDKDGKPNSTTKLIVSIIATMAEEETKTFKERAKSAKLDKIINNNNSYTARPPYGYNYDSTSKQISINEEEARIIRYIFKLCIEGHSLYSIALILNSEGVPTKDISYKCKNPTSIRHNGTWSNATLASMVTNTVYIGKPKIAIETETSPSKMHGRKNSRKVKEFKVLDRPDLAIISEETFAKAADARQSRKAKSNSVGSQNYLLRHLIVCRDCGRYYGLDECRDHSKYKCVKKFDKTEVGTRCYSANLSTRKLDEIIWQTVKSYCLQTIANEKRTNSKGKIELNIAKIETQIVAVEKQKQETVNKAKVVAREALELKIKFPNLPELYDERIKDVEIYNKEIGRLDTELHKYQSEILTLEANIKAIDSIKDSDYIEDIDFNGKFDLLHKVIDKIYAYGTGNHYYILIEVILKTGKTFYIGYFPYKYYYITFDKTEENYYSYETKKGYIFTKFPEFTKGVMLEYDIIKYLIQNDLIERRHKIMYRREKKEKAQL